MPHDDDDTPEVLTLTDEPPPPEVPPEEGATTGQRIARFAATFLFVGGVFFGVLCCGLGISYVAWWIGG